MASWPEIEKVRKDVGQFRSLAARLRSAEFDRSDDADDFLDKIALDDLRELSTRQAEFLLGLRNDAERHFNLRGFNVAKLIQECFVARLDLADEKDIRRIEALEKTGREFITGRELGWFKRICKELVVIEEYV